MSGFLGAPVTKGLLILVALSSVACSLADYKRFVSVIWYPHLKVYHQFWRLLLQPLIFVNSSELFLWLVAMYAIARPVERSWGSRKFTTFVLLSLGISGLFSLLLVISFRQPLGLNVIHPGPTALLFALALQHNELVPSLYTLDLFGLQLTDNFPIAILLLHSFFYSTLNPLMGLLASHAIISHPYLSRVLLPSSISDTLASLFLPFIGALPPPRRSNDPWPDDAEPEDITFPLGQTRDGRVRSRGRIMDEMRRRVGVAAGVVPNNAPRRIARTAGEGAMGQAVPEDSTAAETARGRQSIPEGTPATILATPGEADTSLPSGDGLLAGWSTVAEGRRRVDERAAVRLQVDSLQSIFPSTPRTRIEAVLQTSSLDHNRAVEILLLDDNPS